MAIWEGRDRQGLICDPVLQAVVMSRRSRHVVIAAMRASVEESHRAVDGCGKIFFLGDPGELLHELAVLQDHHGGDRHDAEL